MAKKMTRYPRSILTVCAIAISVLALTKCMNREEDPGVIKNAMGAAFAGSATCANCHKDIYRHHLQTAHYLTSRPAEERYIKGSFAQGKNSYAFNRSVVVSMEKRTDGLYQVEYFRDEEKRAQRFDVVIGSGTMGQSFLYWKDNFLFQLPITYFSAADRWSNSPGFPDKVIFNRVITSRCLECHATYAQVVSAQDAVPEQFDHRHIIYGVDCEKCHGPAAGHVAFQTQHPEEKKGKFIINPAAFSRQQSLDLCASCHGGRLTKTQPSFSFNAGDTLSNYFVVDTTAPDPTHVDVHGNQYALLRASKCFRSSMTMTCNSCHNTHESEKGNVAIFSQRCMSCHSEGHANTCPLLKTVGTSITSNCVDCHMPLQPSKAIAVQLEGDAMPVAAMIRSHFISIYPEQTKKVLPGLKKK
jgi:hypothetical protein